MDSTHSHHDGGAARLGASELVPERPESEPHTVEAVASFDDMGLSEALLRGVYAYGFEDPTAVQQLAVLPVKKGRDVVVQAQSGMGKTGAFAIGFLDRIDAAPGVGPQAVVLSPVRELAVQTARVVNALGVHLGVHAVAAVGGTSVQQNRRDIAAGAQVISGTPGRVMQLIEQGWLSLDSMRIVCLDEADEMLSGDFVEQVGDILRSGLPADAQFLVFSATMSEPTVAISSTFMRDPVMVLLDERDVQLAGIKQYHVMCRNDSDKLAVVLDLYERLSATQSIIFCNRRATVEDLAQAMRSNGFTVAHMHADMAQKERDEVVKEFRSGASRVLVTTDVLARGFDVQTVSMVVNVELPREHSTYTHRVGRAGRHGREGTAVSLVTPWDAAWMDELTRRYELDVPPLPASEV